MDARAPERFVEAKKELDALMRIEEVGDVPVLALGGKADKSGTVEREVLGRALELEEIREEARWPVKHPRREPTRHGKYSARTTCTHVFINDV